MFTAILAVRAGVAELVDAADSKSAGLKTVWVRVPPPAPNKYRPRGGFLLLGRLGWVNPRPGAVTANQSPALLSPLPMLGSAQLPVDHQRPR